MSLHAGASNASQAAYNTPTYHLTHTLAAARQGSIGLIAALGCWQDGPVTGLEVVTIVSGLRGLHKYTLIPYYARMY